MLSINKNSENIIINIEKEINMDDWTKIVEREVLSIEYQLTITNLEGWGKNYEEQIDNPKWGDMLNADLEFVGCENLKFEV